MMNSNWTDTKHAIAILHNAAYLAASERPVNTPALDVLYNAVEHLLGSLGPPTRSKWHKRNAGLFAWLASLS
jgi:hypothetical protein